MFLLNPTYTTRFLFFMIIFWSEYLFVRIFRLCWSSPVKCQSLTLRSILGMCMGVTVTPIQEFPLLVMPYPAISGSFFLSLSGYTRARIPSPGSRHFANPLYISFGTPLSRPNCLELSFFFAFCSLPPSWVVHSTKIFSCGPNILRSDDIYFFPVVCCYL